MNANARIADLSGHRSGDGGGMGGQAFLVDRPAAMKKIAGRRDDTTDREKSRQ